MRITVIPADGAVYKDGLSYSDLDLSFVPSEVHALQWDTNKGWIEFKNTSEFNRPPNENISELPSWVNACLAIWDQAKANEEAVIADQPTVDGVETL